MDTDFYLITALVYLPPPAAPYPLLDRHFSRLRTAHAQLAREIPQSWCASRPFPDESRLLQVMDECVQMNGREKELRIRLTIDSLGIPQAASTAVNIMPSYPIRVVFDTAPTDYITPFHRFKTSIRGGYDIARVRQGATLKPSSSSLDPPFDTILWNTQGEITETTIANCAFCLDPSVSETFITPSTACGLLEGVMRSELLERGEVIEGVVKLVDARKAAEAGTLRIKVFNAARGVFDAYI